LVDAFASLSTEGGRGEGTAGSISAKKRGLSLTKGGWEGGESWSCIFRGGRWDQRLRGKNDPKRKMGRKKKKKGLLKGEPAIDLLGSWFEGKNPRRSTAGEDLEARRGKGAASNHAREEEILEGPALRFPIRAHENAGFADWGRRKRKGEKAKGSEKEEKSGRTTDQNLRP